MLTSSLNKLIRTSVLAWLLWLAVPALLCGRTYYLAPTGNDTSNCRSGAVFKTLKRAVECLAPGDTLIVIEAMKMEHAIVARVSGSVQEILFAVGDQVDEGETLVILEVD